MNSISITLNQQELNKVELFLNQYEIAAKSSHILHLYKYKDATISIYKTKVMVIQSKNPSETYKDIFNLEYKEIDQSSLFNEQKLKINQFNVATVGSDEVGTGDFFGGIVTACAYIKPEQIEWLKSLGVTDSKKLNDDKIQTIFKEIKNEISYEVMNIDPREYNLEFDKYQNSNIIKAVAHNQGLWNLSKKIKRPYFVIIDQFANYISYAKYIRLAHKTEYNIDIFETQAESKYIAVACASIIARVYFLNQIQKINKNLNIELILGSSNNNIKQQAKDIIKQYGIETLKNICKNHFITYKEIIGE